MGQLDAQELYLLPPEQFTAARDAAAKAAGDKTIKALRKPSVAAWLVNLLAAHEADLLGQLLDLGPLLAEAQEQGQGDALRALGAQRRDLVEAVTSRAVQLSGRPATAAVREEVQSTFEAALADPGSAQAVRSGRLVRALSYAGFGGVDLAGAVALPAATTRKGRAAEVVDPVPAAEAAALEAAGRLDDAVRDCQQVEQERADAERRATEAHAEVDRLRQLVRDAEAAAGQADRAFRSAEQAAEKAVDRVRKAQRSEEQARAELDRLRRG